MKHMAYFSPEELASIQLGLEDVRAGRAIFASPTRAIERLADLWGSTVAPEEQGESRLEAQENLLRLPGAFACPRSANGESPRGIPWSIGMTGEFTAASRALAPQLHNGMVEAIAHISLMPTLPMGETVKPLTGMLNGLWRYRLDVFRLVYRPDSVEKRVALLTLVPR